ncbi:MAG: hypothetical protein HY885_02385 [Deltaproteobacteria bacterium]|nr:hypothetical protein [Deltaproteobacteria bacterium]
MPLFDSAKNAAQGFMWKIPVIDLPNGLVIVALLLVVYWCLRKTKKKAPFPQFCKDCLSLGKSLLSRSCYCRMQCNYHPEHRHSAYKSYFQKKSG